MENNLSLVYVKPIGMNSNDEFEYEFFFSETPETVWGEDWNVACPSACNDLTPTEENYSLVERLNTDMVIFCAQQNSCFSLQDCIDGCICLACQSLEGLDEYPEPYRLVLQFGEKYDDVLEKLHGLDLYFVSEEHAEIEDTEDDTQDETEELDDEPSDGEIEEDDNNQDGDNDGDDGGYDIWKDDRYPLDVNW